MSWAEIKKAINSNISKSLDVLITEKSNELLSKLNSVYNTVTVTGNIPSVKRVQRGTAGSNESVVTINISSVNVNNTTAKTSESNNVLTTKKINTNNTTSQTNSKAEEKKENKNVELSFSKPVEGDIVRDFAVDNLIYSNMSRKT